VLDSSYKKTYTVNEINYRNGEKLTEFVELSYVLDSSYRDFGIETILHSTLYHQ